MAYILPSLCTIIIKFKHEKVRKVWRYIAPVAVFLVGVLFVTTGVISIIQQAIQGESCSHGVEPAYCRGLFAPSTNVTSAF